jgi:hypothetical protein
MPQGVSWSGPFTPKVAGAAAVLESAGAEFQLRNAAMRTLR